MCLSRRGGRGGRRQQSEAMRLYVRTLEDENGNWWQLATDDGDPAKVQVFSQHSFRSRSASRLQLPVSDLKGEPLAWDKASKLTKQFSLCPMTHLQLLGGPRCGYCAVSAWHLAPTHPHALYWPIPRRLSAPVRSYRRPKSGKLRQCRMRDRRSWTQRRRRRRRAHLRRRRRRRRLLRGARRTWRTPPWTHTGSRCCRRV